MTPAGGCCRDAAEEDSVAERVGGGHAAGPGSVHQARVPREPVLAERAARRRRNRRPGPVHRTHMAPGVPAPRASDLGAVHARESQPHAVAR